VKLLFVACLHQPEDFEKWLIPHLKKRCEVYPFDYRVTAGRGLLDAVNLLNVDKAFFAKGETVPSDTILRLNEIGVSTSCWTIDDHAHPELFRKPFTTIFTPSPRLIESYRKEYRNVWELPFYVEPSVFDSVSGCGRFDCSVSFLGTLYPGREEKIGKLRSAGVRVDVFGDQWTIPNRGRVQDYADVLRVFKGTAVNVNIHQDSMREVGALNTKMYEIPAAGGFMVADYFPEIFEKFRFDEVAVYRCDDGSNLVDVVKQYLDAKAEREEVTRRARERIFREHTAEKRANFILDKI